MAKIDWNRPVEFLMAENAGVWFDAEYVGKIDYGVFNESKMDYKSTHLLKIPGSIEKLVVVSLSDNEESKYVRNKPIIEKYIVILTAEDVLNGTSQVYLAKGFKKTYESRPKVGDFWYGSKVVFVNEFEVRR